MPANTRAHGSPVTNASRHWVRGGHKMSERPTPETDASQMPLGIGFVGDLKTPSQCLTSSSRVTNASRHWVRGGQGRTAGEARRLARESQMPLGIGFVGDSTMWVAMYEAARTVTNASRHWVRGGLAIVPENAPATLQVTNASRHWVRGGRAIRNLNLAGSSVTNASRHWVRGGRPLKRTEEGVSGCCHKCLSALGSWGTTLMLSQTSSATLASQMPLGMGFVGDLR